jgi:hypothetical protein
VNGHQVHFLDARGTAMRHVDVHVGVGQQLGQRAAVLAGKGHHPHFALERRFDGGQHVGRIARGRDGQQDVSGLAEGLHLFREDLAVAVVVADGRQDRGVGGQRDRRQREALALETADQLGSEVLAVGSRTAVTAGEDLVAVGQGTEHQFDRLRDGERQGSSRLQFEIGALLEVSEDALSIHSRRL